MFRLRSNLRRYLRKKKYMTYIRHGVSEIGRGIVMIAEVVDKLNPLSVFDSEKDGEYSKPPEK